MTNMPRRPDLGLVVNRMQKTTPISIWPTISSRRRAITSAFLGKCPHIEHYYYVSGREHSKQIVVGTSVWPTCRAPIQNLFSLVNPCSSSSDLQSCPSPMRLRTYWGLARNLFSLLAFPTNLRRLTRAIDYDLRYTSDATVTPLHMRRAWKTFFSRPYC